MKIVHTELIINAGAFSQSEAWEGVQRDIHKAIKSIEWPAGSGSFTLYDEPGKKSGEGSGVKPIKLACMKKLESMGWRLETPVDIATVKRPGPMDATLQVKDRLFCVEWETGNISSSHRAINKMALGIIKKVLIGGVLNGKLSCIGLKCLGRREIRFSTSQNILDLFCNKQVSLQDGLELFERCPSLAPFRISDTVQIGQ
jgi:hypothetical protein